MHKLPDLLRPGLDLVICGTAAGPKSASTKTYYAGPGNKFWRTLYKTGLTPRQIAPSEFADLTDFGIGLTDLAKHVSGVDAKLDQSDFNAAEFWEKMNTYNPRIIAFNSKKAAQVALGRNQIDYGKACETETLVESIVFVLPSTSGKAEKSWNIKYWHECAELVRDEQRLRHLYS